MENKLLMGVGRADITPPVGGRLFGYRPDHYSQSVNDSLTATAFYFEQGGVKALMVTACVCLLDTALADRLRLLIEERYGISRSSILICATHTHSGPDTIYMPGWGCIDREYYDGIFEPAVLRAADEAVNSKQPVTVGIGTGESKVGINRRQLNEDNTVSLGQCEWAPYNPQMTVISFKNQADEVVANIIHYGCHGTCAGLNVEISRDWSGVMTDALEEASGAITAFFNGPEGDVGPRLSNGQTVADLSYIYEVGGVGAKDALSIFYSITDYKDVTLATTSAELKIPYDKRISYEDALAGCEQYTHDSINKDKQMAVYFTKVKESYETDFTEKEADYVEQVIIRLGQVALAGFPYELFSEIGMRINNAVPDLNVLSLSNANGSKGYFPTQDQLCRGGYEVTMFKYNSVQCLTDDADYHLMREALRNIDTLKR
ncbi:MAG: neutral/alkaline non-lysosomal ceramidase N-terminal domain-containing protein [Clostridia bacterium]|nr:neutral/alkaline non-lysosomal ceramidase N-terminal domain-containing protein [Clostridia bacterium]